MLIDWGTNMAGETHFGYLWNVVIYEVVHMSIKLITWSEGRTDHSIKMFHNYSGYFWGNIDKMAVEESNWNIIGIN